MRFCGQAQRAQCGSGTGHVRLHVRHVFARLETKTAGIIDETLAHDRQMGTGMGHAVFDNDKTWRFDPRFPDVVETSKAAFLQHFHGNFGELHTEALRLLACNTGKRFRVEIKRGRIDEFGDHSQGIGHTLKSNHRRLIPFSHDIDVGVGTGGRCPGFARIARKGADDFGHERFGVFDDV